MQARFGKLLLTFVAYCGVHSLALGDETNIRPIECGPSSCSYVSKCVTEECRKRMEAQALAEINKIINDTAASQRRPTSPPSGRDDRFK